MHRNVPRRPSPGVRVLWRFAQADQLRQLGHCRDRSVQGSRAEADPGIPTITEPLSVSGAFLPGAAAQREGACRTADWIREAQLSGARATGRFLSSAEPAT